MASAWAASGPLAINSIISAKTESATFRPLDQSPRTYAALTSASLLFQRWTIDGCGPTAECAIAGTRSSHTALTVLLMLGSVRCERRLTVSEFSGHTQPAATPETRPRMQRRRG